MGAQEVRIGVRGRIGDATAHALGGRVAIGDDGFELVVPYIDLAQLVGLLVRLADLHIPFHHVAVSPSTDTGASPDRPTGATS
jgi:hypothetical protein